MKLSDFFDSSQLIRDVEFTLTHMPDSPVYGSICYVPNSKIARKINENPNIAGVFTTKGIAGEISEDKGVVLSDNPQKAYYEFHNRLVDSDLLILNKDHSIHPSASIAPTAIIGKHVRIGENVVIRHGAIINDNTIIEKDVHIEEYAVIGAKGMQNLVIDGEIFNISYAGGVRIGRNSRILSHAIVQRPYHPFYTVIGENSQISVQVIVGHGVRVGDHTFIAGSCQISGNAVIGNHVTIGPSSTISDGITIEDDVQVKLGSVVVQDVKKGRIISGNFAVDHNKNLKNFARIRK